MPGDAAIPSDVGSPGGGTSAEQLHEMVERVAKAVTSLLGEGSAGVVTPGDASSLFISAVRLYAGQSAAGHRGPSGAELAVTPTEAVTAAAALLRSQQLTPFEFAIWYSEYGANGGMEEEP